MDVLVCRCVQEPPSHQTLLARLPSRLSDSTDSTDLLIRNCHDPPQLPKDATKRSITQCYETQPLLIRLLNLDPQTSHLATMNLFGGYMHSSNTVIWVLYTVRLKPVVSTIRTVSLADTLAQRRELLAIVAALVKQITWRPLQPETKQKPHGVLFAVASFSLGIFVKMILNPPDSMVSLIRYWHPLSHVTRI